MSTEQKTTNNNWRKRNEDYMPNADGVLVPQKISYEIKSNYEKLDLFLKTFGAIGVIVTLLTVAINVHQQNKQNEFQLKEQKALFDLKIYDNTITVINNLTLLSPYDSLYNTEMRQFELDILPRIILLNDSVLPKQVENFDLIVKLKRYDFGERVAPSFADVVENCRYTFGSYGSRDMFHMSSEDSSNVMTNFDGYWFGIVQDWIEYDRQVLKTQLMFLYGNDSAKYDSTFTNIKECYGAIDYKMPHLRQALMYVFGQKNFKDRKSWENYVDTNDFFNPYWGENIANNIQNEAAKIHSLCDTKMKNIQDIILKRMQTINPLLNPNLNSSN